MSELTAELASLRAELARWCEDADGATEVIEDLKRRASEEADSVAHQLGYLRSEVARLKDEAEEHKRERTEFSKHKDEFHSLTVFHKRALAQIARLTRLNAEVDPSRIVVWPVRGADGAKTGRWEALGGWSGRLGIVGWEPHEILACVAENMRYSPADEIARLAKPREEWDRWLAAVAEEEAADAEEAEEARSAAFEAAWSALPHVRAAWNAAIGPNRTAATWDAWEALLLAHEREKRGGTP